MKRIVIPLFIMFLFPSVAAASYKSLSEIESAYKQNLIDEHLYEELLTLAEEKLNINSASYDELLRLPGITTYQVYHILEYRSVNGYFRQVEELLKAEGVQDADIENWKIFIVAGESLVGQRAQQRLNLKSQYASTSSDYGLVHYRFGVPQKQISGSLLAEAFKQYENYQVNNYSAFGGIWRNQLRVNKFYFSWAGAGPVQKIMVGDYRIGFDKGLTLNTTSRTHPQGIYAGDVPSNTTTFQTQKTFRGVAVSLESMFTQGTLFSSKNTNPAYGFFVERLPGKRHIEKYYQEEVFGLHVKQVLPKETEVSLTVFNSSREVKGADVWRYPKDDHSFSSGGVSLSSYIGQVRVRGEWSRVLHYGKAFFVESSLNVGWLDFTVHHRSYDDDYYNPHASAYSKHYPYYLFRCRDEVGQMARVGWYKGDRLSAALSYDQFAHRARVLWDKNSQSYIPVYGNSVIDREIFGEMDVTCTDDIRFTSSLKYNNYNIYQDESRDKVTVAFAFTITPQHNISVVVKTSLRSYPHATGERIPGDYLLSRVQYKISPRLQLKGEIKYRKFTFSGSEGGIREYFLETKQKLLPGFDLKLRYSNVFTPGQLDSLDDDMPDLLQYTDLYLRDSVFVEMVMEW